MADDPEFETFLRQFRPRRPAPLPRPHPRRVPHPWILAAAAALVLAVGVWQWTPGPGNGPDRAASPAPTSTTPSLTALNAAMRAGTHESVLDDVSFRVLPNPARPGGALRVLGDVTRDGPPRARRTR